MDEKESRIDALDRTGQKFIGQPLKVLYKNHGVSRKNFALFLETSDGSRRVRLGADLNLSLLIAKNKVFAEHPIKSITRFYEEIHVVISSGGEDNVQQDNPKPYNKEP